MGVFDGFTRLVRCSHGPGTSPAVPGNIPSRPQPFPAVPSRPQPSPAIPSRPQPSPAIPS
eukprot:85825-Prymnesium_polylepis.1